MASFDPSAAMVAGGHWIGGRLVQGGAALAVRRPSDAQVHGTVPAGDAAVIDQAVENAHAAFRRTDWATRPPRDRARVLHRWAALIDADNERLARIESVCSTRPIREAMGWDVPTTAECLRFFAELADKSGGEVLPTAHDHLAMTINEPYGVVAAIAPWNFPLVMAAWKLGAALAAGNAVVLKPSEMTPFSALRLAELAIEAGMPAGIFNVVQGLGSEAGDALVRHPRVGKITFTGSTKTGAAIMSAAALSGVKPVTLELGGKSPQLVFADAPDLDETALRVARSITGNGGQVCVAGSRLIVQESVAERVIERIGAYVETLTPGATWEAGTTLAPIISEGQAQRIEEILGRARAAGCAVLRGGHRLPAPQDGAFFAPTLLDGLSPGNPALVEEVFGPVLTIQRFREEEEAIELARHPTYGLAAGVHTGDLPRALRLIRGIEAGTVWVNRYGRSADFIIPTGGYGGSGIGKDLGRAAFEGNKRQKSVLIAF